MSTKSNATADLYDEYAERLEVCSSQLHQFGQVRQFRGAITTVMSYEDNVLLKQVVNEPGEGRVIVVDTQGSLRVAMIGDNMARRAADNGWAGIVINGAVRDARALGQIPIGVKALGTNPRRSLKTGSGQRDTLVQFGGAVFTPGALLVSDDDGVVVMPS